MTANRNKTHCRNGHELAGDNLYIHPKRGSRDCLTCRRARSAVFNASGVRSNKPPRPLKPEKAARVLAALREGKTLKNILEGRKGKGSYDPGMWVCSWGPFKATVEADPEFGRIAMQLAARNRADAQVAGLIKRESIRGNSGYVVAAPIALPEQLWTDGHRTYEAVREATSDIRSPEIRQEVMSAMFIAIQEQKFPAGEAKSRVKDFVKGYWRENDRSVFSKFGSISLDAPAFDDSATSKYDRISEDQRLWA